MELYERTVTSQADKDVPWEPTLLMPMGDIQYGARGAKLDLFKRDLEWGMNHNALFIGMGDYVDVASPSGRSKWKSRDWYDSVQDAMNEKAEEHLETLQQAVNGTQGRWLGLHEGHHYWEFETGETTDTRLAHYLEAPFLETTSIVNLVFRRSKGHKVECPIWSTHGSGSGVTMASPLNKLERMMSRFPTVRIFLVGHYSRAAGYAVDSIVPKFGKHPKLLARRHILAVTGGYMAGYYHEPVGGRSKRRNRGSYVEQAMMPPTNLGGAVIYITPTRDEGHDTLHLNVLT